MLHRMFATALAVSAGAVLTGASLASAPAGAAEEPDRPLFQMPFPCHEVRQGATYAGHGGAGNHYPIDFNRGAGSTDFGDPVLATAAGTVQTWVEADGDRVVQIRHNAVWTSDVRHLSRATVSDGQRVQQGDKIGEVGRSGTSSPHLHYAQKRNGVAVHLFFDGEPLDPGYSFVYNGPDYRSQNCPDNAPSDLSVSGVADPDGTLTVFARRGGHLETNNKTPDGQWGGWVARGGDLASGPDATVSAAGYYHVVARGDNGNVMYKRQNANGWGDWNTGFSDFNTPFAPAIVKVDNDTLMAFAVRASDKALMKRRFEAGSDGGWENWTVLGSEKGFTSGPDAAVRDNGVIDVVIRGAGGSVRHAARGTDGSWNDFHAIGEFKSAVGAAPAVAARGNVVDVMARGEQGSLWRTIRTDSGWSDWNLTPLGKFNQGPDLVTDSRGGALLMLGRDTDGRIVRAGWNPGDGWGDTLAIPN
ncbi:peptidoglycan DD-metalloendopeptidase family protein [Allorhizocola rhizosphaerae]|uniref:peptidoglycan DD-metalloendopeptidase family protein n=1 Tax=Allorhizocola rhizosphaerae TaxID=1872709 RepID=UPI0013C2CC84|nr:peptidoglycan DD-metalloendopeptidase family protein [Allorhizocola rhizosphaerae]